MKRPTPNPFTRRQTVGFVVGARLLGAACVVVITVRYGWVAGLLAVLLGAAGGFANAAKNDLDAGNYGR